MLIWCLSHAMIGLLLMALVATNRAGGWSTRVTREWDQYYTQRNSINGAQATETDTTCKHEFTASNSRYTSDIFNESTTSTAVLRHLTGMVYWAKSSGILPISTMDLYMHDTTLPRYHPTGHNQFINYSLARSLTSNSWPWLQMI